MNKQELAAAMMRGIQTPGVQESDCMYVFKRGDFCEACALGAALIGKCNGDSSEAQEIWRAAHLRRIEDGPIATMSDMLSIPESLAEEVELMHCDGRSIREIVTWLNTEEGESNVNDETPS